MLFCDDCGVSEQKRHIEGVTVERYECGHTLCDLCLREACRLCAQEEDAHAS